jgi:DNA-binding CsgD family transcriptional regulator
VATAQLEEAANLGDEVSLSVFAAYAPECLARLAAAQGDEPRCREQAARALRLIEAHHNELGRLYVLSALGLLELGLGRIGTAIVTLEQTRTLADTHDVTEPNVVHWHADLVEAYVRAGRSEDALDALDSLERRAHGTGGRWALGTSARCRGLLAPDADADACFAESLAHLEALGASFEIARTHLCRGERLRRSGRRTDARSSLRLAIDGFEELGATPWNGRAQAELRATGATPRRRSAPEERDRLTPHELQVARLVAGGATNKEAAASLFLSTKTIEFHLARIYRKLDVRTRTELAAVAARCGWLEPS